MLLMGVAGVAATTTTGCVAVGPGRAPVAVHRADAAAPGPETDVRPQIVQAPAAEALETVGPPSPSAAPRTEDAAPGARAGSPHRTTDRASGAAPSTSRQVPHQRSSGESPRHEASARPPVPRGLPTGEVDVCGLGKAYGGWASDSPQAHICHEAYGH